MENQFTRTELLLGPEAMERLSRSRVIVFGVGGVGGYVVEVLARSGVGMLALVDNDRVAPSNLNRQIIALHSTLGRLKVDVLEERIHDINPQCEVRKFPMFYLPENADAIQLEDYDYVVDCIDTVKAKLHLVRRCHLLQKPFICSMGAANKFNPMAFRVCDISKTKNDPLAKVLRKQLRREGINHFKCVCSDELPTEPLEPMIENEQYVPASNAYVPAAAGLLIASQVIHDLLHPTTE